MADSVFVDDDFREFSEIEKLWFGSIIELWLEICKEFGILFSDWVFDAG
jgi:hypothetical protein